MSKTSGFKEMKGEVQEELNQLEKHLSEMDKLRTESINKIETKKHELKRLSKIENVKEEHEKLLEELKIAKEDIDKQRLSVEFMDETIANLDEQVAAIQAEHDRIAAEIEVKKKRLQEKISFYEELNTQIEKLVELLRNEEALFKMKLDDLENQKEGLRNNPDLSPELLEQALLDLDASIEKLKTEHDAVKSTLAAKLSTEMEPALMTEVLAEIDRKMESHRAAEIESPDKTDIEKFDHDIKGKLSAEPIYPDKEYIDARQKESSIIIEKVDALKAVLGSKGLELTDSKRILTLSGTAISLQDAVAKGLIDMELLENMGLTVTESYRILNKDGGYVTMEDALQMGLIKLDLPLKGLTLDDNNYIVTPDGKKISIHEALKLGLVDVTEAVQMGLIDKDELKEAGLTLSESNQILNAEGEAISAHEALSMGLMKKALTITDSKRILTPEGTVMSIQEAINKGVIDEQTAIKMGLIDIELLEDFALKIDKSGKIVNDEGYPIKMDDVLEMGLLRKDIPRKLIYTQSCRLLTTDGIPLTIKNAISEGLLDIAEAITIDLIDKETLQEKGYTINEEETAILDKNGDPITIQEAVKLGLFKRVVAPEKFSRPIKEEEEKLMDIVTYHEEETPQPDETLYPSHFTTDQSKTDMSKSPIRTEYTSQIIDEEKVTEETVTHTKDKDEDKGLFYGSFVSQISSITTESTDLSALPDADINYLKNKFGKALTLGLAELVQIQPHDPIHYLAHWLFKYRFNQEIDIIKQKDLEALLAERNRLEAERIHQEILMAAQEAVFDAWYRAENIILGKELMLLHEEGEEEGEYEDLDFANAL